MEKYKECICKRQYYRKILMESEDGNIEHKDDNMGNIIKILSRRIPTIYIERRIDNIETQKLKFNLTQESWLSTDTGNSIRLFGRNEDCNIEVEIPISIAELKDALERY